MGMAGRIKTRIGRKVQGITYTVIDERRFFISCPTRGSQGQCQAISNYVPQVYPGRIILFLSSEALKELSRTAGWGGTT